MSYSTNNPQSASTAIIVAGAFFIIAALLDLITEFFVTMGLFWTWFVLKYLALIVFCYALAKTGTLYRRSQGVLNGAAVLIVIQVILDLILNLGLLFGWLFLFYTMAGVIMLFAASILRGFAFTLAHVGLKRIGRGVGNPVYIIYGWIDLILLSAYWGTPPPADDVILDVSVYADIALLFLVAIMLFLSASKIKAVKPEVGPRPQAIERTSTYQPYQTYRPAQPQQPPQQPPPQQYSQPLPAQSYIPQTAKTEKGFCTHCGNPIGSDDRFCENCGAKVE